MKRVGVHTNVVLSFLTDRDARQQARAAELFAGAFEGRHRVIVHQIVISECVYVMCGVYETTAGSAAAILRDLLEQPGIVPADAVAWPLVWSLWPRRMKDFGDACLIAAAEAGAFDLLATFDSAFVRRLRRQGVAAYW